MDKNRSRDVCVEVCMSIVGDTIVIPSLSSYGDGAGVDDHPIGILPSPLCRCILPLCKCIGVLISFTLSQKEVRIKICVEMYV